MTEETEKPKRPLTEAELAQRRAAGSQSKTMTEAALEQRRQAALHSTGPVTEEGKARSSRNAWKHGLYSEVTRAKEWERMGFGVLSKPCRSTCDKFPCSVVDEGLTQPGGDCLDARVYVEAFDAIMTTLQSGDVQNVHGLLASQLAGAIDILQKMRDELAKALTVARPLVNKQGEVVGHVMEPNPVLGMYVKLLGELGINLPELMATPRAVAKQETGEEAADAIADLFGRLATVAGKGRRLPRTIDVEPD